jgi:hypothetical protein
MKSALSEDDEVELDDEEVTESDDVDDVDDDELTEDEDMDIDDEEITESDDVDDDIDLDDEGDEGIDVDFDDEDEELEVDEELFDDSEVDEDEDLELDIEDDEDLELDIEDEELIDDDEDIELDIEDDEEDFVDDDDLEEGLYARRNGKFNKVTPTQYLESKVEDLEEERDKLANAVTYLRDQLQEVNLFNTKLTYANKLYESGVFNVEEKLDVAVRLDECRSIKQVKREYKRITRQLNNSNPLDQINEMIQSKSKRVISENVYESNEMSRMKKLAGI